MARDTESSKKYGAGFAYKTGSPLTKNPFLVRRLSDGTITVSADDVLKTNPQLKKKRWMANVAAAGERGYIKRGEVSPWT